MQKRCIWCYNMWQVSVLNTEQKYICPKCDALIKKGALTHQEIEYRHKIKLIVLEKLLKKDDCMGYKEFAVAYTQAKHKISMLSKQNNRTYDDDYLASVIVEILHQNRLTAYTLLQ